MDDPIEITPLRSEDVKPLALLHQQAFPGFFLSILGTPFLEQFYRGFLGDPSAVTAVARRDGQALGAVVGTIEPDGFFSRLLRRQLIGFVGASLRAVVARPRALPRLVRAVRYRGGAPEEWSGALLSSICVDPRLQGTAVGSRLLGAWSEAVVAAGATRAFLTTDAIDNERVNRFYQRHGWSIDATFDTPEGRRMHRYTTNLGAT